MARSTRNPATPATPPSASTGGASSSSPAAAAPAATGASPPSAPVKDKPLISIAAFTEKWNTPKTTRLEFEVELSCNRANCPYTLVQFIPPGTSATSGVTFAICRSGSCAGGGTILKFPSKCGACHGTIPEGTVCLSMKTDSNKFTNQHLRNCLLDKVNGTENAAFACAAAAKDIGKECTTCVQADPVIKEGDLLLSSAPLGTRLHYPCARKKRKDFLRLVFGTQDKRQARYLKKQQETEQKKIKIEDVVSFAALAPDSDDEL